MLLCVFVEEGFFEIKLCGCLWFPFRWFDEFCLLRGGLKIDGWFYEKMKELERSCGNAWGAGDFLGVAPVLYLRLGLNEEYEDFNTPGWEGVFDYLTSFIFGLLVLVLLFEWESPPFVAMKLFDNWELAVLEFLVGALAL